MCHSVCVDQSFIMFCLTETDITRSCVCMMSDIVDAHQKKMRVQDGWYNMTEVNIYKLVNHNDTSPHRNWCMKTCIHTSVFKFLYDSNVMINFWASSFRIFFSIQTEIWLLHRFKISFHIMATLHLNLCKFKYFDLVAQK